VVARTTTTGRRVLDAVLLPEGRKKPSWHLPHGVNALLCRPDQAPSLGKGVGRQELEPLDPRKKSQRVALEFEGIIAVSLPPSNSGCAGDAVQTRTGRVGTQPTISCGFASAVSLQVVQQAMGIVSGRIVRSERGTRLPLANSSRRHRFPP